MNDWERVPLSTLPHRRQGQSFFVDVPHGMELRFVVGDNGEVYIDIRPENRSAAKTIEERSGSVSRPNTRRTPPSNRGY